VEGAAGSAESALRRLGTETAAVVVPVVDVVVVQSSATRSACTLLFFCGKSGMGMGMGIGMGITMGYGTMTVTGGSRKREGGCGGG
jgi:hypothetical protein